MLVQKETKIGDIVAKNFRSAQVFEQYGLDFCSGEKKTISEACGESGINAEDIVTALSEMPEAGNRTAPDFNSWEPDFLIDYIVNNHHAYVIKMLPVIYGHSLKVSVKHGEKHPEAVKISDLFSGVKEELEVHMQKEERMLFPYIKRLVETEQQGGEVPYPPFGSVEYPIRVMELEHEAAVKLMSEIKKFSSNYTPPNDACTAYRVLYKELEEFENDLHIHIHLENNVLFPRAAELEKKLSIHKPL